MTAWRETVLIKQHWLLFLWQLLKWKATSWLEVPEGSRVSKSFKRSQEQQLARVYWLQVPMEGLCNFLSHFPIGGDINGIVPSQTLGGCRRDKMEELCPCHIISLEICLSVPYNLICCDAGLIRKITSLIFITPFFFPVFFLMVSFIIHFPCFRNDLEMQVSSNTYMQTIWYLINICCNSSLQFIDSSDYGHATAVCSSGHICWDIPCW